MGVVVMALTVGELVAYAQLDRTDFRRGTREITSDLRSLQTSTTSSMASVEAIVSRTATDVARDLGDAFDPTSALADVDRLTAGVVNRLDSVEEPAGRAGRAAGTEFVDEASDALKTLRYGEFDVDIEANMHIAAAMAELARIDAEIDRLDGRTIDVDVDTTSAKDGLDQLVGKADEVGSAMGGAMGIIGKAGPANVAILITAINALPTVAGVAAGGIVAAIGGGLAAVGFTAAASSDKVRHAWSETADEIKKELADVAKPFEGSAIRAASAAEKAFDRLKPSLKRIFADLVPDVDHLVAMIGKGVSSLGPTLERVSDAAGNVLRELGNRMPAIMDNIGATLDKLAEIANEDPQMLANLLEDATELLRVGAEVLSWADEIKLAFSIPFGPVGAQAGSDYFYKQVFGATPEEIAQGIEQMPQTMANLRTSLEAAANAVTNVGTAGDDAAGGVRNLNAALEEMFDPAAAALDAEIRLKDALKEVAAASKDKKMSEVDRLKSVQDITRAVADAATAESERTGKTTEASAAFAKQLPTLIDLAGKNDAARDAVAGLGNSLGITIKRTDDGKLALDKFGKAIVTLPSGKTVKVDADTAKALAGLQSTKKKTEEIKDKTVKVNADTGQAVKEVGKVTGKLGDLKGAGSQAGKDLGTGLSAGIRSMVNDVVSAAKGLAQSAVNAAKDILGIHSPSKVFEDIGAWTVQGLVKGLTDNKVYAVDSVKQMVTEIKEAFKSQPDVADGLVKFVQAGNDSLLALAKQRDELVERLANAKEYAKQVAGDAKEWASITGLTKEELDDGDLSGSLKSRAQAIKDFANDIKRLAQMGLNKTTLRQIIDAGVEKGATIADMLVGADGSEIRAINKAQKQIDNMSKQLGKNGADALYDVGKKAGDGYLKGLQESLKALDKEMSKIVQALVKAIKKELKIKSPSQVMADIGIQTMEGWIVGIRSMATTAADAAKGVIGEAVSWTKDGGLAGGGGMKVPGGLLKDVGDVTSIKGEKYQPNGPAQPQAAGGVQVTMNGVTVREHADIPRIGSDIAFRVLARGAV